MCNSFWLTALADEALPRIAADTRGTEGVSGGQPSLRRRKLTMVPAEKEFICDWCDGSNIDAVFSSWDCNELCVTNVADYCSGGWNGISCNSDTIESIIIDKKGLIGFLPSSLGKLTNLQTIGELYLLTLLRSC